MQTEPNPIYTPYLEIKDGGYCLGKNIVSDFTLKITRKTKCSAPGKKFGFVTRYVTFTGRTSGESEEFELPVKAMASPVEFRCFCYSRGNYNFAGGGRELGHLIQDLDADYEMREASGQNETSPSVDATE